MLFSAIRKFLRQAPSGQIQIESMESRVLFSADLNPFQADLPSFGPAIDLAEVRLVEPQAQSTQSLTSTPISESASTGVDSTGIDTGAITSEALVLDDEASSEQALASQNIELVFIDPRSPQAGEIASDIALQQHQGRAIEAVVIQADRNGFTQIDAKLRSLADHGIQVSALHLVGHGSNAWMQFGSSNIDEQTIQQASKVITNWHSFLSEDADILLYGCDFASGERGQVLAHELATLSGADVAASTDRTGTQSLGANWTLEFAVGKIDTDGLLTFSQQLSYQGTLALTAQGSETLVNTTTPGQQATWFGNRAVAMDSSGNYVVVWQDGSGIDGSGIGVYGQRFNALGVAQGSQFSVNTFTSNNQDLPQVAMSSTGSFVVTWQSLGQDGSNLGIYAKRYNASGVAQGGEFLVNATTNLDQGSSAIAMDSAGNFVITWHSNNQDAANTLGVYARRYNASGTALSGEFLVNTYTTSDQAEPAIAMDATGNFVIAWQSAGQDGNGEGVYAQRYNSSGTAQGSEFRLNTYTTLDQDLVSLAMDGTAIVAVWESNGQDASGYGIYGQRYNTSGVAQGSEFRVNATTANTQSNPIVTMTSAGAFVVTWDSVNQDGSLTGIIARQFDSSGTALTGDMIVNTTTSNDQDSPSIAANSSGNIVIVWSGNGVGDADGVMMQRFAAPTNAPPVNTVPVGQSIAEDSALIFTGTKQISVNDPDGNLSSVQVSVLNGSLLVNLGGGATISVGENNSADLTLVGTQAQINAALATLSYKGAPNFNGSDTLTVLATDAASATGNNTVAITVTAVNDAPTFNIRTGSVATAIGTGIDDPRRVVIQPDGKIIIAGTSQTAGGYDLGLARYNIDGSLDTSFNGTGTLTTAIGTGADYGYGIALQSDGKILVAGHSNNGVDYDYALARYNTDGTLDTSFSGDGLTTVAFGTAHDFGQSVTVQADGKILVAGYSWIGATYDFAVARFNTDGTLDTSFSGDGKVTTAIGTSGDFASSIAVQSDGKIVVSGTSTTALNSDFAVVRYNADGTLDTTFSGDGKQTASVLGPSDSAQTLTLQNDGKILVGGYSPSGAINQYALVRFNTNGTLDTTFSGDGILTTSLGAVNDRAFDVTVQSDGKILLAGTTSTASQTGIGLVRYNSDGTLDTSFGGTGMVTTFVAGATNEGFGIAVQQDGKIVVTGRNLTTGSPISMVARYNSDGSLDTNFGTPVSTLTAVPLFVEGSAAVVLDPGVTVSDADLDALNAGAGNYSGAKLTLARTLGPSANDIFSASGALGPLTQGGNLVLSGITIGTVTTNSGGTLLLTFNANASTARVNAALRALAYSNNSTTPPTAVQLSWTFDDNNLGAQGSGGAKSVTGSTTVNILGVDYDILISAPLQGGNIVVNTTTAGGQYIYESQASANAIAMDATGATVVVWGDPNGDGSGYGVRAQRFNADGTLAGGEFLVNTSTTGAQHNAAVAMAADGRFVVVWQSFGQDQAGTEGIYAQRFNADGTRLGGEILVNQTVAGDQRFPSIAIDNNGKFVVVWQVDDGSGIGVVARQFAWTGSPIGSEFAVNTYTVSDQRYATVASDRLGNFTIAWTGVSGGDSWGIVAQRYDNLGNAQGGNFQVNTTLTGGQDWQTMAYDNAGNLVIAWRATSTINAGAIDIVFRRYDASGTALSAEVIAATSHSSNFDQMYPALGVDWSGNFTIAWDEYQRDGDQSGIYAQRFFSDGTPYAGEFRVNSNTIGAQHYANMAMAGNGNFMIVWNDSSSTGGDIIGQRYLGYASTSEAGASASASFSVALDTSPSANVVLGLSSSDITEGTVAAPSLSFTSGNWNVFQSITINGVDDAVADGDIAYAIATAALASADLRFNGYDASDLSVININNDFNPVNTVPGPQVVNEDTTLSFTGAAAISVFDIDANLVSTQLSVSNGSLAVTLAGGAWISAGGNNSNTLTLNGSQVQINAALATLTYRGNRNFSGSDTLNILSTDAASLTGSNSVTITVTALNDSPSFSYSTGIVTTAFGTVIDVTGMAIQNDNKIVVVGLINVGSFYDFAVVRYNVDGSLDNSFGVLGIVTTDFGGLEDSANSVAIQADGKIVVGGYTDTGSKWDFALARYLPNGTLDNSFGVKGKVTSTIGSFDDLIYAVAVQADGKIVVTGSTLNASNADIAVVRYNSNGTLDTSFSGDGKVITTAGPSNDEAFSLVVQQDGKIVIAGYSGPDILVMRFNTDGTFDTSFSGDGLTLIDVAGSSDVALNVALQSDGKIVLAGQVLNGATQDYTVVRLNSDGSLDTSLNGTGKLTTDFGNNDSGNSLLIQSDGKIVVGGSSFTGASYDYSIARYNSDGSLDTTFSGDGRNVTSISTGYDAAIGVRIQSDGKLVLAGYAYIGAQANIALVRYNPDGSIDASFGTINTLNGTPVFTEGGAPVILDSDVSVLDPELSVLNSGLGNFSGATLSLVRAGGSSPNDTYVSTGALSALTQGASLVLSGVTIGTVTANSAGTLVLTFNANATTTRVNTSLQSIAYSNSSSNPPTSVQINWTLNDGNLGAQGLGGAASATGYTTVSIVAVNNAPVIAFGEGSKQFTENSTPIVIDALVSLSDPDNTTFGGGHLIVDIPVNAWPQDVLFIANQGMGAGQVGIIGSDVYFGGTLIGSWSMASALDVSFNSSASTLAVQSVMRNISFTSTGEDPSSLTRTVRFQLSDGLGGTSPAITKPITIAVDNEVWVTTANDVLDGNTSDIWSLLADRGADGLISLREAIAASNGSAGLDLIKFNIIGGGVHTINLSSALPWLTGALNIDATTQPGFAGLPLIEINGIAAGPGADGLRIDGGGSTIRGLVINNFSGSGIHITSVGGNTIVGNFIGTDSSGNASAANVTGVRIENSSANTIGGTSAGDRNVISGNTTGVYIWGSGTSANVVEGNYIGTDRLGSNPLANTNTGVYLSTGADNTRIGGSMSWSANIIANGINGIVLASNAGRGNSFIGNSIYGHSALGIDLNADGITLNDPPAALDSDVGPNDLQNYATLSTANSTGGDTFVQGTFNGAASTNYRIDLYSSPQAYGSVNGEGRTILGSLNFSTGPAGDAAFAFFIGGVSLPAGYKVSAIVTVDLGGGNFGSSSEFSPFVSVTTIPPGVTVSAISNNTSENGTTGTFTVVLDTAPASSVTINFSLSDPTEATLSSTAVTFNLSDWNIPKVITVTGLDDSIVDGNIASSVITSAASSPAPNYNGLVVADIGFSNIDNDTFNSLTVTTTSDTADGDTSSIAALLENMGADGRISLREAIAAANGTTNGVGEPDRIFFNIPDALIGGAHTINLSSALPAITDAVVIDASTEPDWAGNGNKPVVVLDGNGLSATGLVLDSGSGGSTIRGLVIRDFNNDGIWIRIGSNGNTIAGNFIGSLTHTGISAGVGEANTGYGIYIDSNSNMIGGASAIDRNVLSGNLGAGIAIYGGSNNLLRGNFIGTDVFGTSVIAGSAYGISIDGGGSGNVIGGVGFGNVIAGHDNGIALWGAGSNQNRIQSNFIGTDPSATLDLGNLQEGIEIGGSASNNLIGGTAAGEGNVIYFNGSATWAGVSIEETSTGNAILGNSIYSNGLLGIQLGWASSAPLLNDANDGDSGANDAQNFPVITAAYPSGSDTMIAGTINSTANTLLRIEFFSSPSADPSTYGEGRVYLGFANVTTDAAGNASFSALLSGVNVTIGHAVSATATVNLGAGVYRSTSEFSLAALVSSIPPGVTVSAISGNTNESGTSASFTVVLNTQPTADVTITLTSSNTDEGTLSTSSLVFTSVNWMIPQSVTVTGVNDMIVDGVQLVTITTSASSSVDPQYNGLSVADVTLGNLDDDSFNTLTVTTSNDTVDGNALSIAALMADMGADGRISLREAILASNATANGIGGADRIYFNIPEALVGGAHSINLNSALPFIVQALIIDGRTDPDFSGSPMIVLNGTSAGLGSDGLYFTTGSSGSAVRSLVIQNFSASGIEVNNGASGMTIAGNFIGTSADGLIAAANGEGGIKLVSSNGNVIGGATAADRNLVSGNVGSAIALVDASNNVIQGNWVGVNVNASAKLANSDIGIYLGGASTGNQIGGINPGEGNVLSGNLGPGLGLFGVGVTNNIAQGNFIGTDASATMKLGNTNIGIQIGSGASYNTIGGTVLGSGNVVADNFWVGIEIRDAATTGNVVQGNFIGTDSTGTRNLGNHEQGLRFALGANANLVGGTALNEGNIFANNDLEGVGVYVTAGSDNAILGNRFYANAGLSIDINYDGVTNNDLDDVDTGANGLQNFPLLSSANTDSGNLTIVGSINSTPNTTLRIEFYSATTADPTNHGEGQNYVGFISVLTDALGNANFSKIFTGTSLAAGNRVSATATVFLGGGKYGDSSEFSANVVATALSAGITVTPVSGLTTTEAGGTANFTVALNTAPTANVTITLNSGDITEGTIGPVSLTFTPYNWNIPQVVLVSGVQDFVSDGNTAFSVFFDPAVSGDSAYNGLLSASVSLTNLEAGNLAPVLSYSAGPITVTEDTPYTFSIGTGNGITVGDTDAGSGQLQLTISVTNGAASLANLTGITFITGVNGGGSFSVQGTLIDLNAALDGLILTPLANMSGVSTGLTIGLDDLGNSGSGGPQSSGLVIGGIITPVNDAPMLSTSGALNAILEDQVSNAGTLVSSLVDTEASDPDAGALKGIAIYATDNSNGTWQYTLDGSTWLSLSGVTTASARLLPSDATSAIRFVPSLNFNGSSGVINFKAWDQTAGVSGGTSDISVSGLSSAFSATNAGSSLTVTSVNDMPSGTNSSRTILENTAGSPTQLIFGLGDFVFSDASDIPSNLFAGIVVTLPPSAGSLTLLGAPVGINQFVSASDILASNLVFTPALNANGLNYDSFSFQVRDNGGVANGGLDTEVVSHTFTIDVTPVNTAPTINTNALTISEGASVVLGSSNVLVADLDHSAAQLTITVSALSHGQFEYLSSPGVAILGFTQADINSGFVQFVLDGSQIAPAYALTASDGSLSVGPQVAAVTYVALNSAPTLSYSSGPVTLSEDGTHTFSIIAGNPITVGDSDAGSAVLQLSLSTSNGNLNLQSVTGLTFISGTNSSGAMTIQGNLTSLNNAINGLAYVPVANFNGAATISFTIDDLGNSGAGGPLAVNLTIPVTVNPVNDAPIASAGPSSLSAILEDSLNPAGATITSLFTGLFSDAADASNPTMNQLAGVAVRAYPQNLVEGAWQFSLNGGASWTSFGVVSDAAAVILAANDLIRFLPTSNFNGIPLSNLSVRLLDNSSVTSSGGLVDVSVFTSSVFFSSGVITLSTSVTSVNDAPSGANQTRTIFENTAAAPTSFVFGLADFGFTDLADAPANTLAGVYISALPSAGTLTLSGAAVILNQFVSNAQLLAGNLVFTPVVNANGLTYASLSFLVQDIGGILNGGVDTDATSRSFIFDITPVNTAPQILSNNLTISEGGAVVLSSAEINTFDFDNVNTALTITVSGLSHGWFEYLAAPGVAITAFSQADIDGGLVRFMHDGTQLAPNYAITVSDGSLSFGPQAATISYSAINSTPTISVGAGALSVNEDSSRTISVAAGNGIILADPDGGLSQFELTLGASNATLTLANLTGLNFMSGSNGSTAMVVRGTLSNLNTALDGLAFAPLANFNGATSLNITLNDLGNTGSGGALLTSLSLPVIVLAINDAPLASGSASLGPVLEDALNPGGSSVLSLFGGLFNDSTDTGIVSTNQFAGVAVRAYPQNFTEGMWQYSLNSGNTWLAFGSLSDSAALSLLPGDLIRFLPAADFNGVPVGNLSVRLLDNSSALSSGTLIDVSVFTSTVAFSSGVVTLATSIAAVNDAPALSALSVAINESPLAGQLLGSMSFRDQDTGDTLTVRILPPSPGSVDAALLSVLSINAAGQVSISDPVLFDYESKLAGLSNHTLNLVVEVTDSQGLSNTATLNITLLDVNEVPSDLKTIVKLSINQPGEPIANLLTTDQDSPESFSYAIIDSPSQAFKLDAATGTVSLTSVGEGLVNSGRSETLTVAVTDKGGLQLVRSFSLKLPSYFPPQITPLTPDAPLAPLPLDTSTGVVSVNSTQASTASPATNAAPAKQRYTNNVILTESDLGFSPSTPQSESSMLKATYINSKSRTLHFEKSSEKYAMVELFNIVASANGSIADYGGFTAISPQFNPATSQAESSLRFQANSNFTKPTITGRLISGDQFEEAASADDGNYINLIGRDYFYAASALISASAVWWVARGLALATAMIMGAPAWRQIDMLPVVLNSTARQTNDQSENRDEDQDSKLETIATTSFFNANNGDLEEEAIGSLFEVPESR